VLLLDIAFVRLRRVDGLLATFEESIAQKGEQKRRLGAAFHLTGSFTRGSGADAQA
jgi:hypothetical protein